MWNILTAINNIINNPITNLIAHYNWSNRANNMGDALEIYIKDAFCNSFELTNDEKDKKYNEVFSYLWNTNNPPDMIIKKSDAIEVKKIESINSAIALNSSYPKSKLYANDSRITTACKNSDWGNRIEKDIIYVVWAVPDSTLKSICFIYWNCYAADKEIYERIWTRISEGIQTIPDIELTKTNELAKVKKIDPLGITDLRVRGMWHIENPIKVFWGHIITSTNWLSVHTIMLQTKYNTFPELDRQNIERNDKIDISNIKIRDPNNPAKFLEAKLISYVQ